MAHPHVDRSLRRGDLLSPQPAIPNNFFRPMAPTSERRFAAHPPHAGGAHACPVCTRIA